MNFALLLLRTILATTLILAARTAGGQAQSTAGEQVYLPVVQAPYTQADGDWPQLGRDPQRSNYTPQSVEPPYCYAWKWNAVPIASRAQPVVRGGLLVAGGMDGRLYARNASTGAPVWHYATGGPIRHSPALSQDYAITGSYDGYTYAIDLDGGGLAWKTLTGSSATAPLIDEARQVAYVASTGGVLTALNLVNGSKLWDYDAGAAILTSPSLSSDGALVFGGSEAIKAFALNAADGSLVWEAALQGQSLTDRYPVVTGDTVIYRSQPVNFFHRLLQEYGDGVMNQAGSVLADWDADWTRVRPRITSFLTINPYTQTFFTLNAATGASRGIAPVLYTYGNNDPPNLPVISPQGIYLTYRARNGIQTDHPTVHVTTQYDAELGRLDLNSLDIAGLRASNSLSVPLWGGVSFRMTSDEPAFLTMGGAKLWVDNWERLGNIDVASGQIAHAGSVSNEFPECYTQCESADSPNPFFPLSGSGPAYPFPGPRETEGHSRAGVVIANNHVYWRVLGAGLAAFVHSDSGSCAPPTVWTDSGGPLPMETDAAPAAPQPSAAPPLTRYLTTDLTTPVTVTTQNLDLVERLNVEVYQFLSLANNQHLTPYYLERGFSSTRLWPYNSSQAGQIPEAGYISHGNIYWHDPGELLYSMAMAYPYLNDSLKTQVKQYMAEEMKRYSPLQNLPYSSPPLRWMNEGNHRNAIPSVIRAEVNNWPPAVANLSNLYALWLWSKNTGDWNYVAANWSQVTEFYNARAANIRYYADIAGLIGYYRMAEALGKPLDRNAAQAAALSAMAAGLNFNAFRDRAAADYPDPRGLATGWSAPVFFGLSPEVGLYLREQLSGQPQAYLNGLQTLQVRTDGVQVQLSGLLWWYLTRAGMHAEEGETSFLGPHTAWSHFLARAYVVGDTQASLRKWLDRPFAPGDLYSIQKTVATIQSGANPGLNAALEQAPGGESIQDFCAQAACHTPQ